MLLMVRAMQVKVGNPLRKLVLIKLADNANDRGECWPSYQHIADQCEISRRSVMMHVDKLCEMSLVKKEYRPGPKGNTSNLYIILLGGAGDSLGVVNQIHQGSAVDSPPPGAGDSPRTSHSLEPVNEPNAVAKKTATEIEYLLPDDLNHEAWMEWVNFRKAVGFKSYKKNAMGMGKVIANLIKLSGGNKAIQMGIVQQSIANQYQGLFPLKGGVPVNYQDNSPHWNSREAWENVF